MIQLCTNGLNRLNEDNIWRSEIRPAVISRTGDPSHSAHGSWSKRHLGPPETAPGAIRTDTRVSIGVIKYLV